VQHLPVSDEGELKIARHLRWIAKQMVKEQTLKATGAFRGIDLPGTNDVLLGRGRTFQDYSGNVKMRQLIHTYLGEYTTAAKLGKTRCASKIVMMIKSHYGRFFRLSEDGWWEEVIDDHICREKVSMAFRTILSTNKKGASQNPKPRYLALDNGKRTRLPQQNEQPCLSFMFER
jgi:hypothetical protein